jgi:hypothetical protein
MTQLLNDSILGEMFDQIHLGLSVRFSVGMQHLVEPYVGLVVDVWMLP